MPVFRPNFFGWVDVVNVERAVIAESTLRAFSSKLCNQREFPFPIAPTLMDFVAALVPMGFLTCRGAKPRLARHPAFHALSVFGPAMGEIARLSTIMAVAFADTVGVHLVQLATMAASAFNSRLFHSSKVAQHQHIAKYFDIACKRIEDAYRQPHLFKEPERRPEQLMLGVV